MREAMRRTERYREEIKNAQEQKVVPFSSEKALVVALLMKRFLTSMSLIMYGSKMSDMTMMVTPSFFKVASEVFLVSAYDGKL